MERSFMSEDKLSKDDFWDQMNPDKLNLSKQDLLDFCHNVINEWKKDRLSNIKYIIAMEIMLAQIKMTPEKILKAIWKKIILWFYDLTYANALANTKDTMIKELRKIGNKKNN
jgi:hypothetical protein